MDSYVLIESTGLTQSIFPLNVTVVQLNANRP